MNIAESIVEHFRTLRQIPLTKEQRERIAKRYINRYFLMEINAAVKRKKRMIEIFRVHCEEDVNQIVSDLSDIGLDVDFFNNVYTIRW